MKLKIDIDEKEFGIDIADHFQDFFKRLRAEIKSRLISNDTLVCGNYELEIVEMFLAAFKKATLEQEPILDKIRAEIEKQEKWLLQAGYNAYNTDIAFEAIKHMMAESEGMKK